MMSLTFGLFTQVSGSGPLGPLVIIPLDAIYLICHITNFQTCSMKKASHFTVLILQMTMQYVCFNECVVHNDPKYLGPIVQI